MVGAHDSTVKQADVDALAAQHVLAQQVLRLFRWFDDSLSTTMRDAGHPELGRPHVLVMVNVEITGTSEAELARRAGVTRQSMHQLVRELQGMELLEVAPDPGSRRSKLVRPTAAAADAIGLATATLEALEHELGRRIGEGNLAALRLALAQDPGPPVAVPIPDHRTGAGPEGPARRDDPAATSAPGGDARPLQKA